jgi:hypothetical protein
MLVIPVNRVVDTKRIIGKNGGPRRRKGTRGQKSFDIFLLLKATPYTPTLFNLTTHNCDTTTHLGKCKDD